MEEHETFKNKFHQKVIFKGLEDKKQTTCVYNYTIQNTYNEKKNSIPFLCICEWQTNLLYKSTLQNLSLFSKCGLLLCFSHFPFCTKYRP